MFEKVYRIHVYETRPDGKLDLYSLFNYMQDIASVHAVKLGFGRDDLMKDNRFVEGDFNTSLVEKGLEKYYIQSKEEKFLPDNSNDNIHGEPQRRLSGHKDWLFQTSH